MAEPRTPQRRARAHPSAPAAAEPAAPASTAAGAPAPASAAPEPPAPGRQRAVRSDAGSGRSSNPDYVQLNVRVPKDLKKQAQKVAIDSDNLTISDVVESALRDYLNAG